MSRRNPSARCRLQRKGSGTLSEVYVFAKDGRSRSRRELYRRLDDLPICLLRAVNTPSRRLRSSGMSSSVHYLSGPRNHARAVPEPLQTKRGVLPGAPPFSLREERCYLRNERTLCSGSRISGQEVLP